MKLKKKLFAIILCALMILVSMASCDQSDGEDQSSKAVATESNQGGKNILDQHFGERDLGNFTLRILATTEDYVFGTTQFVPDDEYASDPVNIAVATRNDLLKSTYNCNIELILTSPFADFETKINTDYMAGTMEYDVIASGVITLASIASNGYLMNISGIENSNLELEEEWWDQQGVNQLSIDNKLYFINGDILVTDDEQTNMLFFNRDIIAAKGMEDPYDLVLEDKWTFDKFHQMVKEAATEGGDGVMDIAGGEDTWGLICAAFDCYKFVLGGNATMVTKNENDVPEITAADDYNVGVFHKVFDLMVDKNNAAYLETYYRWDNNEGRELFYNTFYEGRALFYADAVIATLNSEKMLESDINFGLLPLPKYSDTQDSYACTINPYHFTCISLPNDKIDTDKITFMLEAMAYYNKQEVTSVYYETTLKSKRLHDDTSEKMLDIIFSNRIMDLANIFNWEDCIQYYNSLIFSNSNGIASFMESRQSALQLAIDETIDTFRNLK